MFKVFYEISKQSYCLKRPLSRFNAWFRRIPHASMQLSPCATTAEATCCNYWSPRTLEPVFHNKRSPRRATKSSPHSPQLERAQTQQQSPSAAKSILIINNNFFKRPQPPTHNQEWLFVNITTKINFKCLFKCWNINSSLVYQVELYDTATVLIKYSGACTLKTAINETYEDFLGKSTEAKSQR